MSRNWLVNVISWIMVIATGVALGLFLFEKFMDLKYELESNADDEDDDADDFEDDFEEA